MAYRCALHLPSPPLMSPHITPNPAPLAPVSPPRYFPPPSLIKSHQTSATSLLLCPTLKLRCRITSTAAASALSCSYRCWLTCWLACFSTTVTKDGGAGKAGNRGFRALRYCHNLRADAFDSLAERWLGCRAFVTVTRIRREPQEYFQQLAAAQTTKAES